MSKSVAIICEYKLFPERIGGMDRFFKAFDKRLKKSNYEVSWVFKDVIYDKFYDSIKIYNANNDGIESYFLNLCQSNNFKFDIVITHFLTPVSSFYKNIKNLMNSYVINVDHNPRPLKGFSFKKQIKNRIKGLLYGKYVDKLVGVSEYTKKNIIADFGFTIKNKTSVIYNGIDSTLYKKRKAENTKTPFSFIVVSHLRESKGIQDLLSAICQIDRRLYKDIKIDIYGEGPYKSRLLELQKEYQLENVVYFKGSSSKLNELFQNYNYMLQPTCMECFSLSVLESLSANVPVITTQVGGNLEVVSNAVNGFIFQAGNTKALATIIEDVLSGKKKIETPVYPLVEKHFYLQKMVEEHLNLLPCI